MMPAKPKTDQEAEVKVHKMVVYTGTADVRVIEKADWRENQDLDGPRLVFHAGNRWMVDAHEVGLSDEMLDYFDHDDDGFVVVDSDEKKFANMVAQAKTKRRTMPASGVLHGRAAMAEGAVAKDKIMTAHTGPAEVPGVTDTRPEGVGPMFPKESGDEEPATEEAVPVKAE
jgi:hypothetical protein